MYIGVYSLEYLLFTALLVLRERGKRNLWVFTCVMDLFGQACHSLSAQLLPVPFGVLGTVDIKGILLVLSGLRVEVFLYLSLAGARLVISRR